MESTVLSLPDLDWLSRFLQPKQNFHNHLVTVWWSNTPLPFTQQMFLLASVWTHKACSQIMICCMYNCAAFKSHTEWRNAHVSAPATMMLSTPAGTHYGLELLWIYDIIIIIITLCRQHGYPWPSLATSPCCPLLLAGLQGYILWQHWAALCRF